MDGGLGLVVLSFELKNSSNIVIIFMVLCALCALCVPFLLALSAYCRDVPADHAIIRTPTQPKAICYPQICCTCSILFT